MQFDFTGASPPQHEANDFVTKLEGDREIRDRARDEISRYKGSPAEHGSPTVLELLHLHRLLRLLVLGPLPERVVEGSVRPGLLVFPLSGLYDPTGPDDLRPRQGRRLKERVDCVCGRHVGRVEHAEYFCPVVVVVVVGFKRKRCSKRTREHRETTVRGGNGQELGPPQLWLNRTERINT